ncbi:MAG: hypothetical protein KKE12_02370 [Proteobacteria bacterium]|nr:hypothetical protein [Pseudomonadota bacterium]
MKIRDKIKRVIDRLAILLIVALMIGGPLYLVASCDKSVNKAGIVYDVKPLTDKEIMTFREIVRELLNNAQKTQAKH